MIGLAVIVGEIVATQGRIFLINSVFGFLTGFLICAFSMVNNDINDLEVDKINQPRRPLPSGELSLEHAKAFSIALLTLGLFFSLLTVNLFAILIAFAYAFLSWLYNTRIKRKGLLGNAIVASSLAVPFIYGSFLDSYSVNYLVLVMAVTSFFAGMGRELVKTIADVEGDKNTGIMSFAVVHGEKRTSFLASFFFFLSIATSIVPILVMNVNLFYRYGIVIPDFIFAFLSYLLFKEVNVKKALAIKNLALLGMFSGLLVFLGSSL